MKKRIIILSIIISCGPLQSANTQSNYRNETLKRTIDSIIISESSAEFRKALVSKSPIYIVNDNRNFVKLNEYKESHSKIKSYSVHYVLECEKGYCVHVKNDSLGTMGPVGVFLELDSSFSSITKSDIPLAYKAYKTYKSSILIPAELARSLAEKYFTKKYKLPDFCCMLFYNEELEKMIWEIRKFKGFMNIKIERVCIDAITGDYINKKNEISRRWSIWQAIFKHKNI
jgi:hypothetical protein